MDDILVNEEGYKQFYEKMDSLRESNLSNANMMSQSYKDFIGDGWHDNPILYQTELKETALMAQIRNLREELCSLEIIKERNSDMIDLEDILNPDLLKDLNLSDEKKSQIKEKQNLIIKYPIDGKILINGLYGSGIEETLLYRIAYLICSSNTKNDSSAILVLNPNELYSQFLSEKLVSFITEDANQKTMESFTSEYLNEKLTIYEGNENSENFKFSEEYKKMIEKFINTYLSDGIVDDDLRICDEILFDKDEIKRALFSGDRTIPNYDWASMFFVNQYKQKFQLLSDKLIKKYRDIYIYIYIYLYHLKNLKEKIMLIKLMKLRKCLKKRE